MKSPRFDSQSGYFADALYGQMAQNDQIWLLTGDVGYGVLDDIKRDFPDRYVNVGAAEQSLLDIGVGLALSGKIPICYSITPFLLYRGFETIRNYIDGESIKVILIGRGRDKEYEDCGPSHWAEEDKAMMKLLPNIEAYWPANKEEVPQVLHRALVSGKPTYCNLSKK